LDSYTGIEAGIELADVGAVEAESWFDLRPTTIPIAASPIFDDSINAVIGYRHESVTGVFRIYDLNGTEIAIEEAPLEEPPIDPLDLILVVGAPLRGLVKGLGRGIRGLGTAGVRAGAVLSGGRLLARSMAASVVGVMRASYRALTLSNIKFTATTAARMATKGRHVPLHILRLAIRYGV
jgi:hypothetical protein